MDSVQQQSFFESGEPSNRSEDFISLSSGAQVNKQKVKRLAQRDKSRLQKSKKKNINKGLQKSKKKKGRPPNTIHEKIFVTIARLGRFRIIQKQTWYIIELSKYSKKQDYNSENIARNACFVLQWFSSHGQARFDLLWRCFKKAVEEWRFKQTRCIDDFYPMFVSETDLSYILYSVMNNPDWRLSEEKPSFQADELFFLSLLCMRFGQILCSCESQISLSVLRYYKKNFQLIVRDLQRQRINVIEGFEKDKDVISNKIEEFKQEFTGKNDPFCDPAAMVRENYVQNKPELFNAIQNMCFPKQSQDSQEQLNQNIKSDEEMIKKMEGHIFEAYKYVYHFEAKCKKSQRKISKYSEQREIKRVDRMVEEDQQLKIGSESLRIAND